MMTQDYIREMLEASVADPIVMSERLRLTMSDSQKKTIERICRATGRVDLLDDEHGDTMRAVVVTAFWRTLRNRGNRTIVLAPTEQSRRMVMTFLRTIAAQDPAMNAVVSCPRWYRMVFGKMDDWDIFVPSARPEQLCGIHAQSLTVVALQDTYDMEFEEAIMAAEAACSSPESLFVQLWHG